MSQSRTGKFWVQYVQQVALVQHFIRVERTGDGKLHFYCVQDIFLMESLPGCIFNRWKLWRKPYQQTSSQCLQRRVILPFVVLMNSGVETYLSLSDQTIKQFVMRMMKTSAGMTHCQGITDSTLPKLGPCTTSLCSYL